IPCECPQSYLGNHWRTRKQIQKRCGDQRNRIQTMKTSNSEPQIRKIEQFQIWNSKLGNSLTLGAWCVGFSLLFLPGCLVGPKFKSPAAPNVSGYTTSPLSTTSSTLNATGGEAQHFSKRIDIPGEWWALFHSKPLNDLIERSLKANPDIKAAQAA